MKDSEISRSSMLMEFEIRIMIFALSAFRVDGASLDALEESPGMPLWWNGRRGGLKIRSRKRWGFKSLQGHQKLWPHFYRIPGVDSGRIA